ncbi:MAG: hypothetical protein JW741_13295 [Sedimentisphaerales bacterium]|nr:hypothetical protein [Sedimentisphaerales bacterium]
MRFDTPPNDENFEASDAGQQSWDPPTDSELAAAETAEAGYATQSNKFNRTAIIFAASCVIGLGGIYLFSLRQKPPAANAGVQEAEQRVDQALARFVNQEEKNDAQSFFNDAQELERTFNDYPTKQQVALQELQRNPFSRLLASDEEADTVDEALKRREELRAELSKTLTEFSLQSVLQGPRGATCLINGEVYRIGDIMADVFTVKTIQPNRVVLTAHEMEFSLVMK